MHLQPYVLITAGGTSVPIDRVRKITNDAKGGFGVLLARNFSEQGMNVVLLCTRTTERTYKIPDQVHSVVYDSYDEYVNALKQIVMMYGQPACAISTAAVSDFAPETVVQGKIVSGDVQTLTLVPLPKVLNVWRELFGKTCYLVGCKLTDRDDGFEHLLRAAQKQNTHAHLNLTIANFNPWQRKQENADQEVWLVKPDGGYLHVKGVHEDVAQTLVAFIVRQMNTTWAQSVHQGGIVEGLPADPEMRIHLNRVMEKANCVLRFSQDANLLNGSPGNVVLHDAVLPITVVTPRAYPHKETLHVTDMILARLASENTIAYWSPDALRKPSIDTFVYEHLFQQFPQFDAAIHFHNGWVLNVVPTQEDFPCGSKEESESIARAMTHALGSQFDPARARGVMIELVRHGHTLFFLSELDLLPSLEMQWSCARSAYLNHLADIGKREEADALRFTPIFHDYTIIGVAAQHREEEWFSFFLLDHARGKGLGDKLIKQVIARRARVGVHEHCGVEQFYVDHGFSVVQRQDGLCILQAPSAF